MTNLFAKITNQMITNCKDVRKKKHLMNPLIDCDFCASPYARCRIYWISFGAGLSGKALLVQECVLEGEESEFLWQKDPLVLVQMLGS